MTDIRQKQVAELLGVTVRRVQQLDHTENPPPRNEDGTYPLAELGDWIEHRFEPATNSLKAARLRKANALADLAELDLEKRREQLIPLKMAQQLLDESKEGVRATIRAAVPRLVECEGENNAGLKEALDQVTRDCLTEICSDQTR